MDDVSTPDLHTTALGEAGSLVVFLHGLFGQGKNWTQPAKALTSDHRALLVDLPNHGRSAWTEAWDVEAHADKVAELLSADDPVVLVGHSLGGKVAMALALRHPERVARLCVVDVAPVAYDNGEEFAGYIEAMRGMDLSTLDSRTEASDRLSDAVPHPTVRSFLLQNLHRGTDGWRWQPNLDLFARDLDAIGGWPGERFDTTYGGPVLWIAGERSSYITDDHVEAMERWFPRVRRVTIKDAGHWVHSEQPEVFTEVLARFAG